MLWEKTGSLPLSFSTLPAVFSGRFCVFSYTLCLWLDILYNRMYWPLCEGPLHTAAGVLLYHVYFHSGSCWYIFIRGIGMPCTLYLRETSRFDIFDGPTAQIAYDFPDVHSYLRTVRHRPIRLTAPHRCSIVIRFFRDSWCCCLRFRFFLVTSELSAKDYYTQDLVREGLVRRHSSCGFNSNLISWDFRYLTR